MAREIALNLSSVKAANENCKKCWKLVQLTQTNWQEPLLQMQPFARLLGWILERKTRKKTRTYAARQTHLRLEGFSLSMEHL